MPCRTTAEGVGVTTRSATSGDSPRVTFVNTSARLVDWPTPSAVVLHGIEKEDLWEHAPALARADGVSLATTTLPLEELLETLREFP